MPESNLDHMNHNPSDAAAAAVDGGVETPTKSRHPPATGAGDYSIPYPDQVLENAAVGGGNGVAGVETTTPTKSRNGNPPATGAGDYSIPYPDQVLENAAVDGGDGGNGGEGGETPTTGSGDYFTPYPDQVLENAALDGGDGDGGETETPTKSKNGNPSATVAVAGAGAGDYYTPYPDQVLENVLENVLIFLKSRRDRNAVSLVCKSWYRAEAYTRSDLFIGNCYAVSPNRVTKRFNQVRSVTIKGKPRFADFNLLPQNWGAHFTPWVSAMATAYRALEKIHLKRMSVTDDDLAVVAHCLPNFKELVLISCEGFGTSGLAVVAGECRYLRVLELIEDEVSYDEIDWISCFPTDGPTNLESLAFDCVESAINFESLEKLVARSPMLKKLRLNRHVKMQQLYRLLVRAPQLTHLGTGSFSLPEQPQNEIIRASDYISAFAACRSVVCLSGLREIAPEYLPAILPICTNLTSLNLSYANIDAEQLKPVIRHCHKLQVLWVLDSICDEGLQAVAATCKDLRELRVFPIDTAEAAEGPVSDVGLLAISTGCKKLQSILYFCQQMTNAAVVAMSKNCPDLIVFRLCIIGRYRPDYVTGEPMDEGFGSIVKNCKKLTRLAVSGLLTDRAFNYIGQYGKLVRTLSVAFAGDSDIGLRHVLEGCTSLQKLEIRDSPFGDSALLSGLHHFYNMRFVWMSSCRVTREGCLNVARELPRLVVEVFRRVEEEGDTLYMYRSLDGPRPDAPWFVKIL